MTDGSSDKSSVEKKTVRVRKVDRDLFEQFTALVPFYGHSLGFMFTRVISHFGRPEPIHVGPPIHRHKRCARGEIPTVEVVENKTQLTVTKQDLTEAGTTIAYAFRNIEALEFTDDVDNATLERHVFRVINCKVRWPDSISKLVHCSITMTDRPYKPSGNYADVTIRNVSADVYDEFVANTQLANVTVGEAVNLVLSKVVPELEVMQISFHELRIPLPELLTISMVDSLEITDQDLLEISRKVLLHRIGKVTFDLQDPSLFNTKIAGIYNCQHVSIPDNIPKLLRLSRVRQFPLLGNNSLD